jgi:hypothetical protein
MKKQRKKNKGTTKTGLAMDKELKVGSAARPSLSVSSVAPRVKPFNSS